MNQTEAKILQALNKMPANDNGIGPRYEDMPVKILARVIRKEIENCSNLRARIFVEEARTRTASTALLLTNMITFLIAAWFFGR